LPSRRSAGFTIGTNAERHNPRAPLNERCTGAMATLSASMASHHAPRATPSALISINSRKWPKLQNGVRAGTNPRIRFSAATRASTSALSQGSNASHYCPGAARKLLHFPRAAHRHLLARVLQLRRRRAVCAVQVRRPRPSFVQLHRVGCGRGRGSGRGASPIVSKAAGSLRTMKHEDPRLMNRSLFAYV
jgi:hypothetical protein